MLVECCCQFLQKKKQKNPTWITCVPASVAPPRQTVSFLVAFPVLPLHQRMGRRALSRLPGQILRHDYVSGWNQITGRCHTWSGEPSMTLCVPPHLAWIVARACATFHQISGLVVLYWFAKVFQHKSFNTASTLSHLDFALYPLADGAQTSIRPPSPPCCGVFLKGRPQWTRRDSANIERSSEVLCALMWPGQ